MDDQFIQPVNQLKEEKVSLVGPPATEPIV